jgi:hypothetical protein
MHTACLTRRHALRTLCVGVLAVGAAPVLAKDVWISGTTRTRLVAFATDAVSNLPDSPQRAALPRMVQVLWTFDEANPPQADELRRVQDRLVADMLAEAKTPQNLRLVAIGRAPQAAFWCFYVPENFKISNVTESLAGFDSPDQTMALRLRNRLSSTQRRDPGWTWVEAYLREMARK